MAEIPDLTELGPKPALLRITYPDYLEGYRVSIDMRLDHTTPPVFGQVRRGKNLHMGFEFDHPPTADDLVESMQRFCLAYHDHRKPSA